MPAEKYSSQSSLGTFKGGSSRQIHQRGFGPRGLHVAPYFAFSFGKLNEGLVSRKNTVGHVCKPWECKVPQLLLSTPPLGGQSGGRSELSINRDNLVLCKPPMVFNPQVVSQTQTKSTPSLLAHRDLLGFSFMVAPVSKTARPFITSNTGSAISGHVSKLCGGGHASPKVAPPLSVVISRVLEGKQMPSEAIRNYLSTLGDLRRYQNAFNDFWHLCCL